MYRHVVVVIETSITTSTATTDHLHMGATM